MSSAFEFGRQFGSQKQAQPFNPAVQPLDASTGNVNFDEVSDVVKTPLKALGWLLDASGKYGTRPAVGALSRIEASKPFQSLVQNPVGRSLQQAGSFALQGPLMGMLNEPMTPERAAQIRQGVAEGASFTDTFNTRFEGDALGRFATEAVYDPLNLVGGAGGAARAAGMGARGVRNIQRAEDVINAAQAAPLTVPLKGARAGIRKVAGPLLEKSPKTLYSTGTRNYQNLLDELDRMGLPYDINAEGNLTGLSPEIITRAVETADDPTIILKSTDSSLLGRTFDQMQMQGNPNADLMAQELSKRGMMQRQGDAWIKSGKLNAHQQIDEVSDVLQHGEDEREAWKSVVDIAANRIWKSNRKTYKNIDDVYSVMNFRAMTDLPPETGDELFARLDRNSEKVQDVLSKLETKENIAELLGDNRVENAGIWNWYPRGAELMYNMGFDHSRAFTDEQAEWLFNQPGMQEVVTRLNMDPAATLDRLKNISKIETVTQLIGAGSMNEGPTRNLYNSLTAYRYILEGRQNPFEGFGQIVETKPGSGKPTIRTPRTEEERSAFDLAYLYGDKEAKPRAAEAFARGEEYVTQPGDLRVGGQAAKGYAALAHPEGLLQDDYLRKAGLGKATFGGADTYVHDDVDKMHLFSEVLREETDAFAAYQAAIKNGASVQEAQAIRDDARAQIKGYVSDIWDQRGTMSLEGRLTDDLIEKGIPENYKALATRPTTAGGWFALKSFVHEDLFPYLTGRMPGGGEVPAGIDVHPDADFFRTRYTNPAALQADLWGRFRFRDKNAVEPALKMLAGNPEEVQRILAEEGPDGVRRAFGNLVFDIQESPEYGAGLKEFTDDSQDFLANAARESNTFSNREAVGRLAPQIRTGEGYQTATGEVLEYAPDDVVEAMINGNYQPLMQQMADGLKQGMFQMGENGPVVSFFPRAGTSTAIHEIFGHTMRAMAGPESQREIRRGLGEPVYRQPPDTTGQSPLDPRELNRVEQTGLPSEGRLNEQANAARMSTEAEESFAEGAEALVREGDIGNVGLDEAADFGRMRRLTDLEYMRQQGLDVPDADILRLLGTPTDATRAARVEDAAQQGYESTRLSDPRADAPVREVLDQIALEAGMSTDDAVRVSDRLTTEFAPVFEKNPQLQAVSMWSHPNVRQHVETAMRAGDEQTARRAVEDAVYEMDGLWSSFGVNHPYLSKVQKLLPKDLRKSVQVESRAYGRRGSGSRLSEEQIATLREANAMEAVQKVQQNYNQNFQAVSDIVNDISKAHPVVEPMNDLTTYRDLRRVYEYADPQQKKVMDGFFKTFDVPNMDAEEALNLTVKAAHRKDVVLAHQKALAKQLGLDWDKTPQGISAALQKGTRAWREQALLSVRYHFANGMDMIAKSAIFGVNPLVPPGSAQRQVATWGRNLPRGVRVEAVSQGELGTLPAEFQDEAADSLLPGPIGTLSKKSRSLARTMENVVREAAFAHGARENLQRNMPAFEAALRRELGPQADAVIADLQKSLHGVSFSSQTLADTIVAAGGDARAASRAATIWDRQLDDAFQEGADLSNLVHFDFGDERLIESKLHLRAWAPFHFWATRNIPFYLDTLAAHPMIMRYWQDYNQAAEQEQEEGNLPSRLRGMIPLPGPADDVLDTLFGPGRSYFNPMVVISIADQAKPRYNDPDQPLLGRAFDKLQTVGLAPAPWFSYPLSVLGVYGPEDEQMPVLRHSDIVKNATGLATGTGGLDVEAPLRAATNRAREIVTGKEVQTISGSAYKDYQISKRLADMSVELTGYANHPEILTAMRNPDHPLYKQAEQDVQKENLLTGLQHFVTPIPHKRITEVEQLSRQRQGALPEGAMGDRDIRDALVESGDPAGAYLRTPNPKVLEPVKQDQYGNVQNTGDSGTASGGQQRDTTTWGGDVWGPESPPPFNNPIIMNFYLKRIGSRGYISPEEYVQTISR